MFKGVTFGLVAVLILGIVGWSSVSEAARLETRVLQYHNDRLYFSVGVGNYVFSGCRFDIVCGSDTLYSGGIDESVEAVCYSELTGQFFDSLQFDNCWAILETADLDSQSEIRLACLNINPTLVYEDRLTEPIKTDSLGDVQTARNPLSMLRADRADDLLTDSGQLRYDGVVSYRPLGEHLSGLRTVWSWAPFMAVLVPNLKAELNRNGLLTTSLYYRINDQLTRHMFDGEKARSAHAFHASESAEPRYYPYDPEQGRQLLQRMPRRPREISIGVLDPSLEDMAHYLADILSRDRIRARIAVNDAEADIFLMVVPLSQSDASLALRHLLSVLRPMESKHEGHGEALSFVEQRLESVEETTNEKSTARHLRQANRLLIEDLGVFPLFQPAVYFSSQPNLRGVRFDQNDRIDTQSLVKLRLPDGVRARLK